MDNIELIAGMQARVERCTRLAQTTTDTRAATILRSMAEDGKADIARLLAKENGREGGAL